MADDENTETEESTEQSSDEATDKSTDEESSEAKSGENAEDTTPKSDVDDPEFGKKTEEPANEVQMKYLRPLAEDVGEEVPDDMSEADAASKINEMQENAAS